MRASESKAGESVQRSLQQGPGVDVGDFLQNIADNQEVELSLPGLNANVDFDAVLQQAKKIAGLDILISYIQMLGVWVTVDIWPHAFSEIFKHLALPFSLNLPEFGVSRVTIFYLKMLAPLVLVGCWKLLLRSPYQWKKSFIVQWNRSVMRYMGVSLVVGVAVTLFAWMPSTVAELGAAAGFGVLAAACMFVVWYCVMGFLRYQYISASDEPQFFVQFRATMRTMLLLLLVVIYLPVSQAVADMIVYQLGSSQADNLLQPLHLTVAFVCLIAYVIAIPAGLFYQLRAHCRPPTQPSAAPRGNTTVTAVADATATPKSPQGDLEDVTLLVEEAPNATTVVDFLAEGEKADELASVLSMVERNSKLRSDMWRRHTLLERLQQHRKQEAAAYAEAVTQYESKFGGNAFSRIAMPFDDDKYWWKCVQLAEKCLLVFIITLADSEVAQLAGSVALEGVMLVTSFYVQPFKDKPDGTIAEEDRLDVATRAVMFLTVFCGLMLALFDASPAARTAVDVILVVVVLFNIALILYQLDIREMLLKAYHQLLAIPSEVVQWMRRRQEGRQKASRELYEYVKEDNLYAVRATLVRQVADVDWRNEAEGQKCCLHVCSSAAMMQELIMAGADLRVTDTDGKTALHFMYEGGFGACIELLVRAGANFGARCNAGKFPEEYLDVPRAIDAIIRARRVDDMTWLAGNTALDNYGEEIFVSWLRFAASQKAWEVFPFIVRRFPTLNMPMGELDLQPEGFITSVGALKERNFERLDLVANDITTGGAQGQPVRLLADLILQSTRLVELDLRGNNITWEMATWLAEPIRRCTTLVRLNGYDFTRVQWPARAVNLDMRLKSNATMNKIRKEIEQLQAYNESFANAKSSLQASTMEQLKLNRARIDELQRALEYDIYEARDEPMQPYETAFVCQQLKGKEMDFLNFHQTFIGDDGAYDVAELLKSFRGKSLSLYNADMSDVGIRYIAASLRNNCSVQELDLTGNSSITAEGFQELLDALATNTHLESLTLVHVGHGRGQPWPGAQTEILAKALVHARHVRHVKTSIGDFYPRRIRGADGCTFFDTGFTDREFGEAYRMLLPLNQSATSIGLHLRTDRDQALALSGLINKPQLLSLNLCRSGLSDESARTMCDVLPTLPNLKHLSIQGCSSNSNSPGAQRKSIFDALRIEALCDVLANHCPQFAHLDVRDNALLYELQADGTATRTDVGLNALKRLLASKQTLIRLWVGPTLLIGSDCDGVRCSDLFEGVADGCRIYTGEPERPVLGPAADEIEAELPVQPRDVIVVHPDTWTSEQMAAFRQDGLWPADNFDPSKKLDVARDRVCRVTAVDRKWDGSLLISGRFMKLLHRQCTDVLDHGMDQNGYAPAYNFTVVTDEDVLRQVQELEAKHEAAREEAEEQKNNQQTQGEATAATAAAGTAEVETSCNAIVAAAPGMAPKLNLCNGCHIKHGQKCFRCKGMLAGQGVEAVGCQTCNGQHLGKCTSCRVPIAGMSKPAMICQGCSRKMSGQKLCSFFKRR